LAAFLGCGQKPLQFGNGESAPFLPDSPAVAYLRVAEFNALKKKGATTLDVRPGAPFGEGHAVDSLNIGIASPSFSVWSGFFLNADFADRTGCGVRDGGAAGSARAGAHWV